MPVIADKDFLQKELRFLLDGVVHEVRGMFREHEVTMESLIRDAAADAAAAFRKPEDIQFPAGRGPALSAHQSLVPLQFNDQQLVPVMPKAYGKPTYDDSKDFERTTTTCTGCVPGFGFSNFLGASGGHATSASQNLRSAAFKYEQVTPDQPSVSSSFYHQSKMQAHLFTDVMGGTDNCKDIATGAQQPSKATPYIAATAGGMPVDSTSGFAAAAAAPMPAMAPGVPTPTPRARPTQDYGDESLALKGGVWTADTGGKDRKLDEELYDVTMFYKKEGCSQAIARSEKFERLTLAIIAINAVYIGVDADNNEAPTMLEATAPYQICDNLFCAFFTVELAIRFLAFDSKKNCCRDRWFVFDSFLVGMMVAETWVLTLSLMIGGSGSSNGPNLPTGPLRLLRLLRLSRLVRLLRAMPELLTLINGIKAASRAVCSSLLLIILMNYVFSIVLLMFLGEVTDEEVQEHFGTLGMCMWTLALSGTFMDDTKSVFELLRNLETKQDEDGVNYPWTLGWMNIIVFLLFVLLTNVTIMNMLIGVLCEVVSQVKKSDDEKIAIDFMKQYLRQMLVDLDTDENGQISKEELKEVVNRPRAIEVLNSLEVNPRYVMDVTEKLFEEDKEAGRVQEVTREELMEVILKIRGNREVTMQDLVEVQVDIRKVVHRRMDEMQRMFENLSRQLHRTSYTP
eukprot:TRINITY_DN1787_c0_g1_i2.p1 TRINITY_DN1787_c0_g1~~TRINITY_DN1787_c0_g1_i2.p1  ORF type:complete len:689 (-),score=156.56 TRINITY_DN1787_c0_g1_i2:135-2180(-)